MAENVKVINREQSETSIPRKAFASWSAILSGLVVTVATIWLLSMLGGAVGLSVIDGTDAEAVGNGLGLGTIIWMIVTGLIAFFFGGLVAGRFCGQDSTQDGVLHGLTMWSSAAVLCLILSAWGISGLINTGTSIVANSSAAIAQSVPSLGQVQNTLPTNLEAQSEMASVSATIKKQIADSVSDQSENAISQEEARQTIEQLSPKTMQQIAWYYLSGNKEAARDSLAVNTKLSEQQIDALAKSISEDVQQRVDAYQERADEALADATDYAQGVLWTYTITVMLGLVMSILGGMLGCQAAVKIETVAIQKRRVSSAA